MLFGAIVYPSVYPSHGASPMKFTETALKKLKPKAIRYEVAEANGRGFRLRVYPSGRKSFIARYRFGAASRVAVYRAWRCHTRTLRASVRPPV